MICLYYNPQIQSYNVANESDLMDQLKSGIVSIIEKFDAESQRIAIRICDNLNIARGVNDNKYLELQAVLG